MNPTLLQLQKTFEKLHYVWHPTFNLIGIRNSVNTSNVFNDQLVCAFLQPKISPLANSSVLNRQRWLNDWGITGRNGQKLTEDGIDGGNTQSALDVASKLAGTWRIKTWTITTDPGAYYLQHPVGSDGCAVVVPGQYIGVWVMGYHQESKLGKTHPALVQRGAEITYYRDNDRDALAEESASVARGFIGINCHHASTEATSQFIGKWSAGCQVFPDHDEHAELLRLCDQVKTELKNKFTYTLLREKEIVRV